MALLTKVSKRLKVQTVKNYVIFIENLCIALALTLSCSLESPLLLKCDLEMRVCVLTIARPIPAILNDIIDILSSMIIHTKQQILTK